MVVRLVPEIKHPEIRHPEIRHPEIRHPEIGTLGTLKLGTLICKLGHVAVKSTVQSSVSKGRRNVGSSFKCWMGAML